MPSAIPSLGTFDPDCLSNSKTMNEKWLTLSDATKLLGVHRNTVRLWSDKGILPVHRTQGGHRRFRRREIVLWASSNEMSWIAALEPENMLREAVKNVRMQISDGRLQAESWYQKLGTDAREHCRLSACRLLQGLVNYISTSGADASTEAYVIGYEYASHARHFRLSYVDSIQALHFFSVALIESIAQVCITAKVPIKRATEISGKVHAFTDAVSISLLETYRDLEGVNA